MVGGAILDALAVNIFRRVAFVSRRVGDVRSASFFVSALTLVRIR